MAPFPIVLKPAEAYKYHYFETEIFIKSPLSSVFKRETFEAVRGFREIRLAGDFDMWHRLAKKFNVLLMPDGIIWSRIHDGQENSRQRDYLKTYERVMIQHLKSSDCPLSKQDVDRILLKRKAVLLRSLLSAVAKGKLTTAADISKRLSCHLY